MEIEVRMQFQQAHENVYNSTDHQGNENQNHSEMSPHTC